jgi:hypothetical protein
MTKTFLILTAVFLAIGFIVDKEIISAMAKALAGVFFILAYIVKLDVFLSAEKPMMSTDGGSAHGHGPGHGGHGH